MLERDFNRLVNQARTQDLRQQILSRFLKTGFDIVRALGLRDIPPEGEQIPTIREKEKLWKGQIERLLRLGFHAELGITEKQYVEGIPDFQAQPDRFRGRSNLPLLVDPRVSLIRQLQLHSLLTDLTQAQLTQLSLDMLKQNEGVNTPYQIWVGYQYVYKHLKQLAWDEQPLNVIEGLALLRERPNMFRELGTFGLELANLLTADRICVLEVAGRRHPGPLGFRELNENIKILSTENFHGLDNSQIPHGPFILRGREYKTTPQH